MNAGIPIFTVINPFKNPTKVPIPTPSKTATGKGKFQLASIIPVVIEPSEAIAPTERSSSPTIIKSAWPINTIPV